VRTTILRGARRWDAVGPAWRRLLVDHPPRCVFQTAEWAEALAEAGHDERARWVVAEDDDGPLAVLPFELRERLRGPLRLRVLGNERTSDGLMAQRARPTAVRTALLAALAAGGEPVDLVTLGGLRDGRGFTRLATAATEGLTTEERHGGHSVIATTAAYDVWLTAAGRNLRAGLRKARSRFERRGELTVTTASGPDEVAAAFDEFVTIEASGWKAATDALASQPRDRARLRRFLLAAAPAGRATVRTLRLDGKPAAAQLAATTGETLELLKVAYDDELAELSPSNLLMADLVRTCCERPDVARIDLVTNQPWHARWHAEVLPTYQVRDLNLRRPGGLALRLAARLPWP
jgi:CelD/BcsL family acetyltransferase involved in cellulose biosynthesis